MEKYKREYSRNLVYVSVDISKEKRNEHGRKKDVLKVQAENNSDGVETSRDVKNEKKDKVKTIISILAFIVIIVGGFASGCVRCTNCGDDNTRFFVYASGTSEDGVQYKSCVGPAGCLGFGIDSKCWPTECVHIKRASLTGCVTYYNKTGCIAKSDVKSVGKYSDNATCLGINCAGTNYVEITAESTKATEQSTCLGINCGGSESTNSKNYNTAMPRQFRNGCWGNN